MVHMCVSKNIYYFFGYFVFCAVRYASRKASVLEKELKEYDWKNFISCLDTTLILLLCSSLQVLL
jgi:hypothetical protein